MSNSCPRPLRAARFCSPALFLTALLAGCGHSDGQAGDLLARDDLFTVAQDSSDNALDVLANDVATAGSIHSHPTTTAQGGTLSNDGSLIHYTPPAGFSGGDSFDYTMQDSRGNTASASVNLVVQGDGGQQVSDNPCVNRQDRLDAGLGYCVQASFDTAHDGTTIDFTLYLPHPDNLATMPCPDGGAACDSFDAGNLAYAPLVIHSHGFGGAKNADFSADPEHFVDNQAAQAAWNQGYFVISFSERGFGQSGGQIGLMTREREGLDHQELVDWAIKHIRGPSAAGDDGVYDFEFDANNAEHTSSLSQAGDTRPSLLMNDAQTRLDPAASDSSGNPAIGMLGYSYGGGWQYTASASDTLTVAGRAPLERFDALVPEGTWHDLRYSLHNNDVPKGYWISLLFSFAVEGGTLSNGEPTPTDLNQAFLEAQTLNRVNTPFINQLAANGTHDYCDEDNGVPVQADVFHIQGVRDTLFDFSEGYDSVKCFADAGRDARFLLVSGGHPLTVTQQDPYTGNRAAMDIDEIVHCPLSFDADNDGDTGLERLYVTDMIIAWFEEKLRGVAGAADIVPQVCLAVPNTDPADMLQDDRFHPGSDNPVNHRYLKEGVVEASIDDVRIGAGANPAYTCDGGPTDGMAARCDIGSVALNIGGTADANLEQFVPLYTVPAGEPRIMAGIPTANLALSSLAVDPIVFVGMGLMRDGTLTTLHDQIMPIRNASTYPYADTNGVVNNHDSGQAPLYYGCSPSAEVICERGRLKGVAIRLLPGDQVGPVFSSADVQYPRTVNAPGQVTITGDIELPIYPTTPLPETNHP